MSHKPIWAVQSNGIQQTPVPLTDVIRDQGIDLVECNIIPFSDEIQLQGELPHDLVIPYGSTSLVKHAPKTWKGLFFDEKQFKSTKWVSRRGDMLNQDIVLTTMGHALDYMVNGEHFFIRPNSDLKEFPGEVTTREEFQKWFDLINGKGYEVDENTSIVIAPAKPILEEYRFFVVDGEVVDGSLYKANGRLKKQHVKIDDPVLSIAKEMARDWLPAACVCMDVARMSDGYKVIEFNCINATGWYDNDLGAIVKAVTSYVNEVRF